MPDNNKVKFGLSNVHYALLTLRNDGTAEYGTPKALPGAVSLTISATGDRQVFYADDIEYYISNGAMGGEGTLTVAKVTDDFHTDIFGMITDANGVMIDNRDAGTVRFALLFEFSGDKNKVRHVLYNCTASRPAINSETGTESKTPITEELTLSTSTIFDSVNNINTDHAKIPYSDSGAYTTWYESVYQTSAAAS